MTTKKAGDRMTYPSLLAVWEAVIFFCLAFWAIVALVVLYA